MAGKRGLTRRDFLATSGKGAAAIGVGAALAGGSGQRRAMAQGTGAARKIGANDRIVFGVIGSGGMGTYDGRVTCFADDNVLCGALCDVAEFRLDRANRAISMAMDQKGHKNVKIERYGDHRELLDRKDIDAVIIATPDLWHYRPFLDAVDAGKHIYQEKPFSFTIEQGIEMWQAARKHPELTVQIGTQRRSRKHYPQVKKLIDDGVLGDVHYVRAFDCRNYVTATDPFLPESVASELDWKTAKIDWDRFQQPCENKVSFDPLRYCAWRWYWDYAGGLVTDVGVHVIDNVHWLLNEPTPKSAVCNGGVYGVKYWETPDVVNAVWDYGTFTMVFTSNFTNGFEGDGYIIYGTKATMEVRGDDVKVWAEGQRDEPLHHIPPERIDHQHNWIHCIRSGERPNAPVELGHSSLLPSHMANLAYRSGRRITWDPVKMQTV